MSELEQGREYSWDDVIEKDTDFVLLPEGDYDFEVLSFGRGRHNGSDKLPPCNKAVLSIKLTGADGSTSTITHNLFLHSRCEGMLCAFFTAIGQRKHGEALRMNWQTVVGSTGRCKVSVHSWTNSDGEKRESNQIKKFYEPSKKEWKPGEF